jgi:pseudouridine-5'-phosphate glycosidase
VPVIGYGTDEFPAFWSRRSGLRVPLRMDTPEEIAHFLTVKWEMAMGGGVLVCNPAPESSEIPAEEMRTTIDTALGDASARAITGKAVTPFVLGRIVELTGGRSLRSNIALAESNARLAAAIVTHL